MNVTGKQAPAPTEDTDYLTLPEVSRRLRIGQATTRMLIVPKELKGYKIGGTYRVSAADLAEYLKSASNF